MSIKRAGYEELHLEDVLVLHGPAKKGGRSTSGILRYESCFDLGKRKKKTVTPNYVMHQNPQTIDD